MTSAPIRAIYYVVTELLEGETLRDRIARGPLPWRKAAEMGAAVVDGLAAAHSKGIVHQDIKPASLFLTSDGRLKILDFGLAQIRKPPAEDGPTVSPTEVGNRAVMGTIGYMSLNRCVAKRRNHPAMSFRWAPAFTGKSAGDTLAAIFKEEPPGLADSGKATSPEFERVIERCLAKSAAQRFHSAHDLAFALRSPSPPAGERRAALPLKFSRRAAAASIHCGRFDSGRGRILSVEKSSRGTHRLAGRAALRQLQRLSGCRLFKRRNYRKPHGQPVAIASLKVMSHDAVFRYKGKNSDARAAGRELGVPAVLTGRIVQRGDNLSVSADLVDVEGNAHLWGEQYDPKVADGLTFSGKSQPRYLRNCARDQAMSGKRRSSAGKRKTRRHISSTSRAILRLKVR